MTDAGSRLKQFCQDIHQEVLASAGDDANPQLREELFTDAVLARLSDHNESDGTESCYYEAKNIGRVPAAKLNAWALSGDGATLDLFVTRYHGTGEVEDVGKPETRRYFELVMGFLKRARDGFHARMEEASSAFHVAQQIHEAHDSLTTVRLFFLTDGVVRSLDIEEERIPGLEVRYVVWDLDKLSRLRVGHREVIELDFVNDYGGSIPCLQTADDTGEYRTFLAFLRAPLLARIYGEYGQRLLERNVRAFLQAKGKVNRGLQKTLKEEPHRFLAYNNGLCCTAADVRVQAEQDGHALLEWVKDFQIVNGGQTTASIYHAIKKEKLDVSQVIVQVKLTVLRDPAKVPEIVPLISQYANSQNAIRPADLSANGPFHHKLEQLSRNTWAPAASGLERGTHWYYERARGSYADDKARQGTQAKRREWELQNPKAQTFTKTDVAKFEYAWLGLPHLVCLGGEKNFVRFAEGMAEDGEPVVDQTYFKHLVAKAILFRTAEKVFSLLKLTGFRANCMAYSVAWLAAQSGHRINLDRIWEQQRVSQALYEAVKVVCGAAHRHIESQTGNQGEASKREICWNEFKNMQLATDQAWLRELADKPFLSAASDEDALCRDWEAVRNRFVGDSRTIGELAALTGKTWVVTRNSDPVSKYAECTWGTLRAMRGFGLKKLRGLVELFSAAAR